MKYETSLGTVYLPIDQTKINYLLLSGGFDSAVLLCLFATNGATITPVINHSNDILYPIAARKVVDFVNGKYGSSIPAPIHLGDPTASHSERTNTVIAQILRSHSDNSGNQVAIWQGITRNPDVGLSSMDSMDNFRPVRKETSSSFIHSPFKDFDKRVTVALAESLGVTGEISKITASCTMRLPGGRCGECFQCKERAWAFSSMEAYDCGKF